MVGNVEQSWIRRRSLRVYNSMDDAGSRAGPDYSPLVKMCRITSAEDAALVGMIVWPKSKRSVSWSQAREICAAAREFGAEPVGVFLDESAGQVEQACDAVGLSYEQLHGEGPRASASQLPTSLRTICVMHANSEGCIQTTISPDL